MEKDVDGKIHIGTDEVRGAVSKTNMRYVLGFSLIMAIALLTVIWVIGALTA